MTEQSRQFRVPVMMSRAEIEAVDAWRRMQPSIPSRAEAIRSLVALGLQGGQEPAEIAPVVLKGGKRPSFDNPGKK